MSLSTSKITKDLPRYGEIIQKCDIFIKQGIHYQGNSLVQKYACALLNSGGGLLKLHNVEHRQRTHSKHLDVWWSSMENILTNIISSDDICNYFDLVGSYDDQDLYLFVRIADHLCTLDYHARLPTDTATRDISHHSALKLVSAAPCGVKPGGIKNLPPIPAAFHFKKTNPELKQESRRIQFKQLTTPTGHGKHSAISDKIRQMMVKYVSAFANHEGGRIYFGIEDELASVLGVEMTEEVQERTVKRVTDRMNCMIWGDVSHKPVRGVHWDIEFRPIIGCPTADTVVAIISVSQFQGGVFMSCPESFYVREGEVVSLSFDHWKSLMLKNNINIPALHAKFMQVDMPVPNPRLVFTLPDCVSKIKDKLFQASNLPILHPKRSLESLPNPTARLQLHRFLEQLGATTKFLAIYPHCWGICLPYNNIEVIDATVFLMGPSMGLQVLVLGSGPGDVLMAAARAAAVYIKHGITMNGACLEKFFITCHAADIADPDWQNEVIASMMSSNDSLPSHFRMGPWKHERILQSLVLCIAMYKSYAIARDLPKHYFTLTLDQFELLWTRQYMRELWIHGPAGSGKTLLAINLMRELRRRGYAQEEILYLAENERLCEYIGSFNLALTTCRRPFLADSENPKEFEAAYRLVKNVIVDEAQNFKDRDGNWYGLAESLVNRWIDPNAADDSTQRQACADINCDGTYQENYLSGPGYFWVFMDYAGKVHRFAAGLPGLLGKNNFMLTEVTRSTGEIFNFARKFLDCDSSSMMGASPQQQQQQQLQQPKPHIAHQFQGDKVKVIRCEDDSMKSVLMSVLSSFQEKGVKLDDMAILLGKRKDSVPLAKDVNQELTKNSEDTAVSKNVTVDTVKRFSGLEKPVVIGLNLKVNEENADFNKFMANLVSRATEDVVIITAKDLGSALSK